MKTTYKIVLIALIAMVLAWFLPWLLSLAFPSDSSDPFVSYSPVCDEFVIVDFDGEKVVMQTQSGLSLNDEERDSLLPQIYYSQLVARQKMPDSIKGIDMSVPNLRHRSWVFSSRPYEINKVQPRVYMMMESAPARFELEDPEVAFRLDGKPEFLNMADNSVNPELTARFSRVFAEKDFAYPPRSLSANITARKGYDEGYLIADARGDIYHVKMRASRPYMVKVDKPDSVEAAHVFIMENDDPSVLGLVFDTNGRLYALEREGYRLAPLPVTADPARQRVMIMADPYSWVVKTSGEEGSRWTAIKAADHSLLGVYEHKSEPTAWEKAAPYLPPVQISITDNNDSYARLRFHFPWD